MVHIQHGDGSSTETRESDIVCFQLNKQLNSAIVGAGQLSTTPGNELGSSHRAGVLLSSKSNQEWSGESGKEVLNNFSSSSIS